MSFYVVIDWNPADEPPFQSRFHTSKPYSTKRKAWGYVQRAIQKAKLSGVQLHDIAVFDGKPRDTEVDLENQRVHDYAAWRLHGRQTFGSMFL